MGFLPLKISPTVHSLHSKCPFTYWMQNCLQELQCFYLKHIILHCFNISSCWQSIINVKYRLIFYPGKDLLVSLIFFKYMMNGFWNRKCAGMTVIKKLHIPFSRHWLIQSAVQWDWFWNYVFFSKLLNHVAILGSVSDKDSHYESELRDWHVTMLVG